MKSKSNDREAALERDNAELRRQLAESLAQQQAAAEVLQVINSSPGDLTPVFETILEKAHSLCAVAYGSLQLWDGEKFRAAATHGLPPALDERLRQGYSPGPNMPNRILIEGAPFVQIPDLADIDDPVARRVVETLGARTHLMVALRNDDRLLGQIVSGRREVRAFSDREIRLQQNFAAQAVIAMENARLLTETREALEQQTATAEVLGVINSSPGDLAPVFEAMLEKACALCEADFGTLTTFENGQARTAATHGVPSAYAEFRAGNPPDYGPQSGPGRILAGEAIVHVRDLKDHDLYRDGEPNRRAIVDLGGARSYLAIALRKTDELVGSITVYRQQVQPFTDKQIALLENFAAQAVIAMENVRLITETREALERQTAVSDVLEVISASPGQLQPVFDAILSDAVRICGGAFGLLGLWENEGFRGAATSGVGAVFADTLSRIHDPPPGTSLNLVQVRKQTVHQLDCAAEAAYDPVREINPDFAKVRTNLTVPMLREGEFLGALAIYRDEVRPFDPKQIELVENFAAQAVIAMENARLLTETREALEQQTATAEILGVINSSPGELSPVFEAMLEKAMHLCEASFGSFATFDGMMFHAVAHRGVPDEVIEALREPLAATPGGHLIQVVEGQDVVPIDNFAETEAYRSGKQWAVPLVDKGNARTAVWVALRRDTSLLGVMVIYRTEIRPFTDKQIALMQNFAAQAVIAMESARLITETREALEQQTATAEVLGVINASPGDLAPVFDAILEKAHRLCGVTQGSLELYDGEIFRAVATRGLVDSFADELRRGYRASDNPVTRPLITGEPFAQIPDTSQQQFPFARRPPNAQATRTLLCVPLRRDGKLLGMIASSRLGARAFSDKEISLLQNFAAQAVIAMENARLITETREALEQQTATAEVLQVINASPGDLAPVFEAILEKAHILCDASFGTLFLRDGDDFRGVAMRGLPEPFAERMRQGFGGVDAPISKPLLDDTRYVQISDISTVDHPIAKLATEHGTRTVLSIPLRKDDTVLGLIIAARAEVRVFSEREIALVENFAAQAVIAMENARLLGELRQRTEEVAELNRGLEARVAEQVDELGRVGRLKRFLAPQLAELIVSQGDEKILESHRREIVVVFCDLRGYTAFTETAEPEEVLDFLREYHGALGPLVAEYEGTLDQFSGDGIMVFFNDPVPIPDPAERAVKMAMAMREAAGALTTIWRRRGRELGFGAGIAQGYATLGQIGFSERSGYTAIGTVCNVAARLCAGAKDGQILIAQRVAAGLDGDIALEDMGPLPLKGMTQPVVAFNVAAPAAGAGRLRLVEP